MTAINLVGSPFSYQCRKDAVNYARGTIVSIVTTPLDLALAPVWLLYTSIYNTFAKTSVSEGKTDVRRIHTRGNGCNFREEYTSAKVTSTKPRIAARDLEVSFELPSKNPRIRFSSDFCQPTTTKSN